MTSIIYTRTDESPRLASASLLPVFQAFLSTSGLQVEEKDISLAGRVLALFSEVMAASKAGAALKGGPVPDALKELGHLVEQPDSVIVKLPNISASVPQLKACICELKAQNFDLPEYEEASDQYAQVLGSAVNPVLRQGNSDRRAARAVKLYAQKHPHKMSPWSKDSKTRVVSMRESDFYANEKAIQIQADDRLSIKFVPELGDEQTFKSNIKVGPGDVVDASFLSLRELQNYLGCHFSTAREEGLLLSLHLKSTMMKVSDPIIFGEVVKLYFDALLSVHREAIKALNFNPRHGVKDLFNTLNALAEGRETSAVIDQTKARRMLEAIDTCYAQMPRLAMTNSDKGLTHLHVPSDVIIDASMPAMIRAGGKQWDAEGKTCDTIALIPDRSYAGVYQAAIDFCKKHGAFDVATMGHVSNVGLMAQKAQEYGSHDKTFQVPKSGVMQVQNSAGEVLLEHKVDNDDIWRMCLTRGAAIDNWLQLACSKATDTKQVVFWLDKQRAHDGILIERVQQHLQKQNKLNACIMAPTEATTHTLTRSQKSLDTVSATGNVLRDYLTDLFPILELGTSSKMLSIVPLLKGGGLFETGAGGSAPRHVDQLVEENHLRWDSLGEFLAMAEAILFVGQKYNNPQAVALAEALSKANEQYLNHNKAPQRAVKSLDTRGSHFYLAFYWAQALAQQSKVPQLRARFQTVFEKFQANEKQILQELSDAQGHGVDLGGYYHPDPDLLDQIMRPSPSFNSICNSISS